MPYAPCSENSSQGFPLPSLDCHPWPSSALFPSYPTLPWSWLLLSFAFFPRDGSCSLSTSCTLLMSAGLSDCLLVSARQLRASGLVIQRVSSPPGLHTAAPEAPSMPVGWAHGACCPTWTMCSSYSHDSFPHFLQTFIQVSPSHCIYRFPLTGTSDSFLFLSIQWRALSSMLTVASVEQGQASK